MVAVLADIEATVRADRQVIRITHLPRLITPRAPRIEQLPLGVENLDAVVATVGDEEPVVLVDRQGSRLQEFARLVAVPAPLAQPFPLGREDLDPVVLAILGDVEVAGAVDHHVGRITEPARRRSLHAVADLEQELAALGVNEHAVKVGVGHQQPAITVDGQPAGAVHVKLGGPPAAQILAVAVEHLDAVGQIGEEQVVLRIERGGPRLVQMPGLDPVHSPDQVRLRARPQIATRLCQHRRGPAAPGRGHVASRFTLDDQFK